MCYNGEKGETIPGCENGTATHVNFCVKKSHFKGIAREVSRADNLNECEGKCTGDASCANGLVCYNGEEGETIPGCEKGAATHVNFCVNKSHFDGKIRNVLRSEELGACEGSCEKDSDCVDGLVCFQRPMQLPNPPVRVSENYM